MQTLNPYPSSSASKAPYLASDLPAALSRDPLPLDLERQKTTLLSFIVKTLLLAMEEHPIMRAKVVAEGGKSQSGKEGKWLEVAKNGTIAVAVSGESFTFSETDS
jgi:2-oxoisovalerate dehydrogenase E2 component (dihydrolipoyl transacylase)